MRSVLKTWYGRFQLEVLLTLRDRRTMMFTVFLPFLLLLLIANVVNQKLPDISFAQYLTSGMIASGLVYGGFQSLGISIPEERRDGTLKRLYGTPMPRSAYFAGKVGNVVVIYCMQIVLMLGLGVVAFHVTIPTSAPRLLTFLWISALALVSCAGLGIAFSSLAKSAQSAAALATPIVLFLQFTSGVFFVFKKEPVWMQDIASLFPLRWICQGMRAVFLPSSFGHQEVGGSYDLPMVALVLGIWSVVAIVLCLRTFRWLPVGED